LQKPLIKAIGKLHPRDDKHRIFDGIREILFSPLSETAPFLIDMLFIRDERDDAPVVNAEDGAKLVEWMSGVLKKGGEMPYRKLCNGA